MVSHQDIIAWARPSAAAFSVAPRGGDRAPIASDGLSCVRGDRDPMAECKHGLRSGCSYCHVGVSAEVRRPGKKRLAGTSRLSEKMNDRMTALRRRLREIRGE
jgi:hypothetical protein